MLSKVKLGLSRKLYLVPQQVQKSSIAAVRHRAFVLRAETNSTRNSYQLKYPIPVSPHQPTHFSENVPIPEQFARVEASERRVLTELLLDGNFRRLVDNILRFIQFSFFKISDFGAVESFEPNTSVMMTTVEKWELRNQFHEIMQLVDKNDEYQYVIEGFLNMISTVADDSSDGANQKSKLSIDDYFMPVNLFENTTKAAVRLVESLIGPKEFEVEATKIGKLITSIRRNPVTRAVFSDYHKFIMESIENPDYVLTKSGEKRFDQLLEKTRMIMSQPNFVEYSGVVDHFRETLHSFEYDGLRHISNPLRQLFSNLAPSITQENILKSLKPLKEALLPLLKVDLGSICLPRVMHKTESYEYSFGEGIVYIDGLKLENLSLFEDVPANNGGSNSRIVKMTISGLTCRVDGAKFAYRRTNFPQLEDCGIVDIGLGSNNMFVDITWSVGSTSNEPPKFVFRDVVVSSPELHFKCREAEHPLLSTTTFNMLRPMLKIALQDDLERVLLIHGRRAADFLNDLISKNCS